MNTKTLCLGVLSLGEASGYEIKKKITEGPFGQFHSGSFGSIYPALTALCAAGCATVRDEAQHGRPDKRVYGITAAGREALVKAIMADPADDRVRSDFMFILFFGELLPPRRLDALFETRVAALRHLIAEMDAVPIDRIGAGARFVLGLGRAIHQAQVDYIEDHRHELLAAAMDAEPGDAGRIDRRTPDGPAASIT